jgi:hypothetical protein
LFGLFAFAEAGGYAGVFGVVEAAGDDEGFGDDVEDVEVGEAAVLAEAEEHGFFVAQ